MAQSAEAPLIKAPQSATNDDTSALVVRSASTERVAAQVISTIFLPFDILAGWVTVRPNEVVACLHFGVLTSVHEQQGCHKVPFFGMETRRVSVMEQAHELHHTKVVDAVGAPVMVGAVINYRVVEPLKAMFAVEDYNSFMVINAQATLKQVVSAHSYNELKSQTEVVNAALLDALSSTMERAGVQVTSITLSELNYAHEIAAAMLKKQQAGALIEARALVVEGAVRIAQDAVTKLEQDAAFKMSDADKTKIVTNLLTVTCSDTDATPTIQL